MPCLNDGYPPSPQEILDAKAPALLCGLLNTFIPSELESRLNHVDWESTGVTREEFNEWWMDHKLRDRRRKETIIRDAKAKLTPIERRALGLD